jgi:hypothetical protein
MCAYKDEFIIVKITSKFSRQSILYYVIVHELNPSLFSRQVCCRSSAGLYCYNVLRDNGTKSVYLRKLILKATHWKTWQIELFHQPTLMHNFLYLLTICLLHYYLRHVSSINMPIFRRKNYIHTASDIFALCKRLHSTLVESGHSPLSTRVSDNIWQYN